MSRLSDPIIDAPAATRPRIELPAVPALTVNAKEAALMTADGELMRVSHERAQMILAGQPALVCHVPYTRHRLLARDLRAYDVLELFAFVHPAKFCVPTPVGLCRALGLPAPQEFEDYPFALIEIAQALLSDLQKEPRPQGKSKKADPVEIAQVMGLQGKGWNWTPYIHTAFGQDYDENKMLAASTVLSVWRSLPEWAEHAPPPPPSHQPVTGEESRKKLDDILSYGGDEVEARPQQKDYTTAMTAAFAPVQETEQPHVVLAEAGTGVGKTLGYLAPAAVWSEKNDGAVWVSTYTKNLQRQIVQELEKLYPHEGLREEKVAVRKGRENYLCLLNLEDTVNGAALARYPNQTIAAGIMARWAKNTKDGDMQGGDFPGWLPGLLGYGMTRGLADKRGECIYSACNHYHKCFVEKAARKAQHADIVVANHALVMIQTALATDESELPQRYVFDEGHHLFYAADSAFAAHLTARETSDLRRWILGHEGGRRSRARGLSKRLEDLIAGDDEAERALQDILQNAHILPSPGWTKRLKDSQPHGITEQFFQLVYKQVFARDNGRHGPYSLETEPRPLIDELPPVIDKLKTRLRGLRKPMRTLIAKLRQNLEEYAESWDSDTKKRVEAVCAALERRAEHSLSSWINMLETLTDQDGKEKKASNDLVDWMEIERIDGQAYDVGLYRHWVDPTLPMASALKPHAHGIAITSATLRDRTGVEEFDWHRAKESTGAIHLTETPTLFATPSPYDYAAQSRVFVVTDVDKNNAAQVANAYRILFETAGGGALGLFTAVQRLRVVHERIHMALEKKDIPLYAQHIDEMDTGTLVDIFREDNHACLLGTDAVRDGIDVPGDSLRLLVYDRVPWPRPTILHKARRKEFGQRNYDEMLTRLKLRQAFGRLTRRASDKGVFIMMDSRLPTRMLTAFPEGVPVERLGLMDVINKTREFLQNDQ